MFKGSFKKMLSEKQVLSPCVWDCYSMKAVELAGFDCALLSGSSVSESLTGIPDLGLISVDELVGVAERVAHFASIPLVVDFDEGYGDSPLNVARNVEKLLKAGVSGFTLDDGMGVRGYTKALIAAIPTVESRSGELHILEGDIPSPVNPPKGCKFHTRCDYCTEICRQVVPKWEEVSPNHFAACHNMHKIHQDETKK